MRSLIPSFALGFGFWLCAISGISQSNSVELFDGSGNLLSSHGTIDSAYSAIPATLSNAYVIEITTSYTGAWETYPIEFVNKTGASATNTITVRPSGSATNIVLSAAVSGDPIFYFNNADYVRVDGRPGGLGNGNALTVSNTATTSNSNTFELANGSSYNVIRNCTINNATTSSAGRNVAILGGAANSYNLISTCVVNSGRYAINSSGLSTDPNVDNVIYGCKIIDPIFAGIWVQANTAGILIDSNEFYSTSVVHDADYGVILFDSQLDTAIIRRNTIRDLNTGSNTSPTMGIQIRTVATTGNNYVRIENNIIDLSANTSSSTSVVGIKFAGSALCRAGVYHNTIHIGDSLLTGGTSGNIGSACIQNAASNTSNVLDSKNNLYVNLRRGGTSGLRHVCVDLSSTSGTITADFNTYNTYLGHYATLGTTLYTSFSGFQTAANPNEINGNTSTVAFVSSTDFHLDYSMFSNVALNGTPITGISEDIDAETRSFLTRGADEITQCQGVPDSSSILYLNDTVCLGDTFTLTLFGLNIGNGISCQWQQRTVSGSFTNISGATGSELTTTITGTRIYRVIATCSYSSMSDTTDEVTMALVPNVNVNGIGFTHTANSYTFQGSGVQNAVDYYWEFGDGDTALTSNPTHDYANPGPYTVMVVVSNFCGTDTAYVNIEVDCFGAPGASTTLYTDNTICVGQQSTLHVSGLNAIAMPYFDYQWQSSVGSAPFTNMSGETDDSLTVAPLVTTRYRCVVTCDASSQSSNSSTVTIFVQESLLDSITYVQDANEVAFTLHGAVNISSYSWNFGDGGTSSVANPTHTYTDTGHFTVTFIGTGPCDTVMRVIQLYIECAEEPVAGTIQATGVNDGNVVSFSTTGGSTNVTYLWNFGDGSSASGANPTHTYSNYGTYTVTLLVENACGDASTLLEISIVTGISTLTNAHLFQLYPNPTDDAAQLVFADATHTASLKVYNTVGQLVWEESNIQSSTYTIQASTMKIASGTYLVEVTSNGTRGYVHWIVR